MSVDFYVVKYIVEVQEYSKIGKVTRTKREFGVCEDAVEFAKKNKANNTVCRVYQIREVVWY